MMRQEAPYPQILEDLVKRLRYRPGWTFELKDIERDPADTHGGAAGGLTLIGLTGDPQKAWAVQQGRADPSEYVGAMDAYHPDTPRPVYFYFPVPAATYNERSWRRWLFDCLLEVEKHEAMEHFQLVTEVRADAELVGTGHDALDGPFKPIVERPFSPNHGPGNDPYMITEVATELDRATSFRGTVNA